MEHILSRAEILIQQRKYAEAESFLKDLLSTNPNDPHVLALLAEVRLQRDDVKEAETCIDMAIGISPDSPHLFYLKARICMVKKDYDAAEKNINHALQLDPADADYYALWASMKLRRKQYATALELADHALELDPENLLALNTRSTALLKLDNKEESFQTIEGALREDPNNAYTHSNYGWGLLEKGEHKKALEHFREALKNDPTLEYAKAGMAEALKASNRFYRLFLRYAFWIGNLTKKYQWGVLIGFYLGFRGLNALAQNSETLRPYLTPLIILLAIIAFSTWVISPISNLFLRLNPYGKHLLDKQELISSNFVGFCLIIFLAGVIGYLVAGDDRYLLITAYGFAMMVPCGSMFSASRSKYALVIYTVATALIGIGAIVIAFDNGEIFNTLTTVFTLCFVAFQWIANYMIIRESNV